MLPLHFCKGIDFWLYLQQFQRTFGFRLETLLLLVATISRLQKGYKDNTFFLTCLEAFEFFLPPAFIKDYRFSQRVSKIQLFSRLSRVSKNFFMRTLFLFPSRFQRVRKCIPSFYRQMRHRHVAHLPTLLLHAQTVMDTRLSCANTACSSFPH